MTTSKPSIRALVIAGGAGTRLWPLSTDAVPKQFLPLVSERPLIVETARRLEPLVGRRGIYVSTNERYRDGIARLLPEIDEARLLFEPSKRNTAAALALSTVELERLEPPATVVVVTPADQWVSKPARLRSDLARAARRARDRGEIVTVGIVPSRPETGYGYLHPAERGAAAGELAAFVEKPDRVRAKAYVRRGDLWNAGIFVATLATFREAFLRSAPEVLAGAERAARLRWQGDDAGFRRAYGRLRDISFDYAVGERFDRLGFVRSDCGWSDVGGWAAIWEARRRDGAGNVVVGEVEADGCEGCLLWARDVPLRVRGRRDAVVVASAEGTFDAPLGRT